MADTDLTDPRGTSKPGTRGSRRRAAAGLAVAAVLVLVAGCSSGTDEVVSAGPGGTGEIEAPVVDPTPSSVTSVTTGDPDVGATPSVAPTASSTPSTSVPPAVSVPGGLTDPTLTMALFWVRYPDDARTIDIPGYRDSETGPRPLVVYGSATNDTGAPVVTPQATVEWSNAAGEPAFLFATAVLLPGSTTPAPVLQPGETGDVIFVITDDLGVAWPDLTPELQGGAS